MSIHCSNTVSKNYSHANTGFSFFCSVSSFLQIVIIIIEITLVCPYKINDKTFVVHGLLLHTELIVILFIRCTMRCDRDLGPACRLPW